jgi:hypothetical protein
MKKYSIQCTITRVIEVEAESAKLALEGAPEILKADLADTDPDVLVDSAVLEIL